MARAWLLLLIIACILNGYEARSNICLKGGGKIYKPLQLYPSDCPNDLDNCTAFVYNYDYAGFKSRSVATLLPNNRESLVYLTQDDNDHLDVVVITKTSYKNNVIKTQLRVTGSAPADILLKDDPGDDWTWDSQNNEGDFTWYLEPTFTDGVVAGHFKIVEEELCVYITYLPNWVGAITKFTALSGTTKATTRPATKPLSTQAGVATTFDYCTFPRLAVSKTAAACGAPGSATATSLDSPATYAWKKNGVTIGTTNSMSSLAAGTYTVVATVSGCEATREVVIESVASPISFNHVSTPASHTQLGRIDITLSGGYPPYSIWFINSVGTTVARNVTTYSGPPGSYTIRVVDGCNDQTFSAAITAPDACAPGTKISGDDCVPCPAGTYSTAYDSTTCTVCPPGNRSTVAGATSCPSCPANTVTNGGNSACTNCPKNTYSFAGSGTCTPCPLGTSRDDGESECSSCGTGSFRCSSAGSCTACPAGSYGTSSQAAACIKCPAGTYQGYTGATSCITCPKDKYAPSGSSGCLDCPTGLRAPAGSSVLIACV